ncbi:DnaJ domain family protein [Candida parapsilosis]|uniref:DnaJ domain family protein n=1 Tax=Candida parapsilosis TaxID=5480 RepID=A0A8X7TE02_CANPA|nr:DnaJ domain family protein [Candida parapsilosis]KAF6055711.1 DnaJ domain family protein [Candida parapsilosis]KAF6058641.1 DnaJ domain family protein [Candida parapsilosis]KAF6067398.1 DnaJ domain family protein [Candida parapsilosis]
MASSEYNYDEEGETWPFFVLALSTFVLIPLTIKYATRLASSDPHKVNASVVGAITENADTIKVLNLKSLDDYKRKQRSSKIFNKTLLVLIIGWSAVLFIGKYLTKETDMSGLFDPYTILDVSFTASEREIKSHYRKLSLKYHPDKLPRDLTEEARLKMEQEYIRLTSAYKALTDEATRENFIKYGHPDGEQPTTHGIALPKFLVEGKYSSLVVISYFALIGVLLPWIVGKWWNNVKSYTKQGLHVKTAASIVRKLADKDPAKVITPDVILDHILDSEDVNVLLPHLSIKERKELVYNHFNREFTDDEKREKNKTELVAILPHLIDGLIDIALFFRLQEAIIAAEDLKKAVLQAVSPNGKYQELLQLPFVDDEIIKKQQVKKLGKLFALEPAEAQKALGIKDYDEFKRAMSVAASIPSLRIIEAEVKVPGEETVTPNSSGHISVKFLVKSPKLKSCPEIDEDRLKDEETLEYMKNPFSVNDLAPKLPFAFTPYFPQPVRCSWTCYIIAQRENKLVENSKAYALENIDLSNLNLTQEEWINGEKVTVGTFKIPLPAASGNVGKYYYRLIMKNNAYYGSDVDVPVDLEVVPPSQEKSLAGVKKLMEKKKKSENLDSDEEEEEEDSDSDISDPEEDSLAGALAALRGEATSKKSDKIEEVDDEEDEDVFTDINTDTEDEAD